MKLYAQLKAATSRAAVLPFNCVEQALELPDRTGADWFTRQRIRGFQRLSCHRSRCCCSDKAEQLSDIFPDFSSEAVIPWLAMPRLLWTLTRCLHLLDCCRLEGGGRVPALCTMLRLLQTLAMCLHCLPSTSVAAGWCPDWAQTTPATALARHAEVVAGSNNAFHLLSALIAAAGWCTDWIKMPAAAWSLRALLMQQPGSATPLPSTPGQLQTLQPFPQVL